MSAWVCVCVCCSWLGASAGVKIRPFLLLVWLTWWSMGLVHVGLPPLAISLHAFHPKSQSPCCYLHLHHQTNATPWTPQFSVVRSTGVYWLCSERSSTSSTDRFGRASSLAAYCNLHAFCCLDVRAAAVAGSIVCACVLFKNPVTVSLQDGEKPIIEVMAPPHVSNV